MCNKNVFKAISKAGYEKCNCTRLIVGNIIPLHRQLYTIDASLQALSRLCNLHMESTAVISLWLQFVTAKKEIDSKLKCADKRVNATVQGYFLSFLKEMIVTLYTCNSMKKNSIWNGINLR